MNPVRFHEIRAEAKQTLARLGLDGWRFLYDAARTRAGCCHHSQRTITLSRHYVAQNALEDIHNTILHECAHALAGPGHGHGAHWGKICIRIGAKPERCYGEHIQMPIGKWQANCPKCGKLFHRHRRPRAGRTFWCLACGKTDGEFVYRAVGSA